MHVSISPPSWLGHCPYCNSWVEMNLRSCPHCKKAYSAEQIRAIQNECKKRKRESQRAIYLVLGLAAGLGIFIVIDLELYKLWF